MDKAAGVPTTLVTGATGFVGANLVLDLAQNGHRVVAYDLNPPTRLLQSFWQPAQGQIIFEIGNVVDAGRLADVAGRHTPEAIIHAAAITALEPDEEARMATSMVEVNVLGTARLLDLARRPHVRRIVYISSTGVYGATDPEMPLSETASLPLPGYRIYTLTKEVSERLCLRYATIHGTDIVIGRLNGPYGPMEREAGPYPGMSPVYKLARAALKHGRVGLRTSDFRYDYTYIKDLARSIRLLVESKSLQHRNYNLSSGRSWSVNDVTSALGRLIPSARFEWLEAEGPADVEFSNPPRRGPMDITRLRADTGYEPHYDLEAGLRDALPWWREMLVESTA